jgi:hypothetical protein
MGRRGWWRMVVEDGEGTNPPAVLGRAPVKVLLLQGDAAAAGNIVNADLGIPSIWKSWVLVSRRVSFG